MQADKASILTATMTFNDKDGAAFWPIYREYEHERSVLDDGRVSVIKEYTQKYPNLTDSEAKDDGGTNVRIRLSFGGFEEEVLQKIQQGASGIDGDEVLSVGSSHRLAGGYASRSLASSTHAGKYAGQKDSVAEPAQQ